MIPTKRWYQSKTVWFNIVIGLAGALTALSTSNPNVAWIVTGASVVNGLLRILSTATPIA
jgi:hypothetical protein